MTEVFADTFYWLAGLNPHDAYHAQVSQYPVAGRLVTTWAVQIEVMDAFSAIPLRSTAVDFWKETNADPNLVTVLLDARLLSRAADMFANRPDKNWTFTDCISFIVMEERQIRFALTKDRHFEQAGFQVLFQ